MNRQRWAILTGLVLLLGLVAWWLWPQASGSSNLLKRLFTRHDATWTAMQDRGTWRVGMDPSFPPFESLDDTGEPVGYDVDLAHAIAATWGLQVEIIPIGYDSLLDALMTGRIDSIVSAFPYDERATRDVTFSPPYFEAGLRLVVNAGSPISDVVQLDSKTVAVEWGSMGDMVGRRFQRQEIALELAPYATPQEAIDALVDDPQIDALLIDQVSLREAQGEGAAIIAVGAPLEGNPYAIVSPWTARQLSEQIVDTLATLAEDGTLAELESRWFGPMPPQLTTP